MARGYRSQPGANTSSTFSVSAYDQSGNVSSCSSQVIYTSDTIAPPTPTIAATDPLSPSNNNFPEIKGSGAEDGSLVRFYDSPDCPSRLRRQKETRRTSTTRGSPSKCRQMGQ